MGLESKLLHKSDLYSVLRLFPMMFPLFSSSDSTIKLWDTQKNLVADITLDNTLSTACFLNSSGDILLAFKNDIYVLSHSKTLGLLNANIDASSISAAGNLYKYINRISSFLNNISYSGSPIPSTLTQKQVLLYSLWPIPV